MSNMLRAECPDCGSAMSGPNAQTMIESHMCGRLGPLRFHTCPVCWREVAETYGVRPAYYRHSDKAGNNCPMSGQPIVAAGPEVVAP